MSRRGESLQAFAEIACYCPHSDGFILVDASDPDNRQRAENWLKNELCFLRRRDKEDLRQIWKMAICDGRDAKLVFNAVKILQEKYA